MPWDFPALVPDEKEEPLSSPSTKWPMQRGTRQETIKESSQIVLAKNLRGGSSDWCVVIGDKMLLMKKFLLGPLSKPRVAIQEKAAYHFLAEFVDGNMEDTIKLLLEDSLMHELHSCA